MIIAYGLLILAVLNIIAIFAYKIEHDEDFDSTKDNDGRDVSISIIVALISAQYIWG